MSSFTYETCVYAQILLKGKTEHGILLSPVTIYTANFLKNFSHQESKTCIYMAGCLHRVFDSRYVSPSLLAPVINQLEIVNQASQKDIHGIIQPFLSEPTPHEYLSIPLYWDAKTAWTRKLKRHESMEILLARTLAEFTVMFENPNIQPNAHKTHMKNAMDVLDVIWDANPQMYAKALTLSRHEPIRVRRQEKFPPGQKGRIVPAFCYDQL